MSTAFGSDTDSLSSYEPNSGGSWASNTSFMQGPPSYLVNGETPRHPFVDLSWDSQPPTPIIVHSPAAGPSQWRPPNEVHPQTNVIRQAHASLWGLPPTTHIIGQSPIGGGLRWGEPNKDHVPKHPYRYREEPHPTNSARPWDSPPHTSYARANSENSTQPWYIPPDRGPFPLNQ
jgi:hypothetical protein